MRFEKFLWLVLFLVVVNFIGGSVISREEVELPAHTFWYGFHGLKTTPGNWCLAHNVTTENTHKEVVLFRPAEGPISGDASSVECTEFVPVLAYWHYFYSDLKYKN